MKILVAIIGLISVGSAHAADVTCVSNKKAHAYYGDEGQWTLIFDIKLDSDDLHKVALQNREHRNLGAGEKVLKPDPKFVAKNPRYRDFNRYITGDAWCSYNILLPQGLNYIEDRFDGLIYSNCEAGDGGSFKIYCRK